MGVVVHVKMIKEDLIDKLTLFKRLGGDEGGSHVDIGGRSLR